MAQSDLRARTKIHARPLGPRVRREAGGVYAYGILTALYPAALGTCIIKTEARLAQSDLRARTKIHARPLGPRVRREAGGVYAYGILTVELNPAP